MILRFDRIAMELPPPSDPDPAGAAAVQELMGGRFGEMSTFMNYTFQSWNFRGRQGARPFYDLVANIAAEEFGHVELVATAINTMLTGATPESNGRARTELATKSPLVDVKGSATRTTSSPAARARFRRTRRAGRGQATTSSRRATSSRTSHNFFLETGARNNKLKVYEMVEHPAARALTGYLLVRGGVHQVASHGRSRDLTGANLMKMFPTPRIATEKIPECQPHIERGDHLRLYRFSPDDYRIPLSSTGRIRRRRRSSSCSTRRPRAFLLAIFLLSRRCLLPATRPRRSPRSRRSCASRPVCRRSRRGWWRISRSRRSARRRRRLRGRRRAPESERSIRALAIAKPCQSLLK